MLLTTALQTEHADLLLNIVPPGCDCRGAWHQLLLDRCSAILLLLLRHRRHPRFLRYSGAVGWACARLGMCRCAGGEAGLGGVTVAG